MCHPTNEVTLHYNRAISPPPPYFRPPSAHTPAALDNPELQTCLSHPFDHILTLGSPLRLLMETSIRSSRNSSSPDPAATADIETSTEKSLQPPQPNCDLPTLQPVCYPRPMDICQTKFTTTVSYRSSRTPNIFLGSYTQDH